MKALRVLDAFVLLFTFAVISRAGTTVWGFNASFGNPHIQAYDLATGVASADFVAPHPDANRGRANGRGIAVVGTKIYYSLADTPNVYVTDTVTHADLGIAFTTILTPGINSLAWDGASLWMVASQPTNANQPADDKVYQYSPTGQLLKTMVLARPANTNLARDGLEITPAGIVANRNSVPYDIYDFSGNLVTPFFITASFRATGIAFDGTEYIVSDTINGRLATFDLGGNFVRSVTLTGAAIPFGIMDLSAVASGVVPPGVPSTAKVGAFRSGFFWLLDVDGNQQFNSPPDRAFPFGGIPGDIPITGDWNGSGTTKVGIYRSSQGQFILDFDGDGQFTVADKVYNLGVGTDPTDVPVVGDWSGDGRTKVGLFRQGFFWILDFNGDGVFEQGIDRTFAFGGISGDVPVVGDWTGTGVSRIGIVRQGFLWILDANGNGQFDGTGPGQDLAFPFGGIPGDVPVVGDWNGDGRSKPGVFRLGFFWVLDANGNFQFDGTGPGQDRAFAFGGMPGDVPVVGKW